ncbi:hypothetical protein WDU94_011670 [Cyamophila willieti]
MYIFYLIGSLVFLVVSRFVSIEIADSNEDSNYMLLFVLDRNNSPHDAFQSAVLQNAIFEQYAPHKVLNIEHTLNNIILKVTRQHVMFFRNDDTKLGVVMNLQMKHVQDLLKFNSFENSTDLERSLITLHNKKLMFGKDWYSEAEINISLEAKGKAMSKFRKNHTDVFKDQCALNSYDEERSVKYTQSGNSSEISLKQILNPTNDVNFRNTKEPSTRTKLSATLNSINTASNKAEFDEHNENAHLKVILFKSVSKTDPNESRSQMLNYTSYPMLSADRFSKINIQNLENVSLVSSLKFIKQKVLTKIANIREFLLSLPNESLQHNSYVSWNYIRSLISEPIETAVNRLSEHIHSMRYQGWIYGANEVNYWYLVGSYLNSHFKTSGVILVDIIGAYYLEAMCLIYLVIMVLCYQKFTRKIKALEKEAYQNIANFEKLDRHLYVLRKDLTNMLNINEMALNKCKQGVDLHFKMTQTNLDILGKLDKRVLNAVEDRLKIIDTGDENVKKDFQKNIIKQDEPEFQLNYNYHKLNQSVKRNYLGDLADSSSSERTPRRVPIKCNHNQLTCKAKQKPHTIWTNQQAKGHDSL